MKFSSTIFAHLLINGVLKSYSKIIQSEHHIYQIQCSDWTILEYMYEIRTQKFYDHDTRTYYILDTVIGCFESISTKIVLKSFMTLS